LASPARRPFFSSVVALASPILPEDAPVGIGIGAGGEAGTEAQASRPRPRIRGNSDGGQSRADAKLRFGAITIAALADSVNPCAFATIIILVAMMSSAKRTRNEIIAVCLSFTAAVFVTYFAIGLFLYKVIAVINDQGGLFLVVADCIYYLAFLLCVVFGLLSLRDAYILFSGRKAEEMVLQLPKSFKKRINLAMAKGVRAEWLVVGVFIAGVTVSFFEAACTGQVYLPTIIALAKISFWHTMLLLTWYNFLFILPLLIIFGLVLWGVTSAQLADFFKKNVAWTKLALGIVFVLMGLVLWNEMFWPPGYRG
jgi:cytochrome c biogenesis protein CcdA